MNQQEETFLTLMKIMHPLMDEDLSDRFQISKFYVSRILISLGKAAKKYLKSIAFKVQNLSPAFRNIKYSHVRHVVYCSEIFFVKPQNIINHNQCWSAYMHHHSGVKRHLINIKKIKVRVSGSCRIIWLHNDTKRFQ